MKISKKLINASAGTGKTYQISLEYIKILLENKDTDLSFDEIMVITFTKKATAEIKQRILQHLKILINPEANNDKNILINNLKSLCNIDVSDNRIIDYLSSCYYEMLTHKERINISTIDGFINSIFRSIVAPFYNVNNYDIDNEINNKCLPEIYEALLNSPEITNPILNKKVNRNLDNFDPFIKDIISQRWLFHLAKENLGNLINVELSEIIDYVSQKADKHLKRYKYLVHELVTAFQDYYIQENGKDFAFNGKKIFLQKFYILFSIYFDKDIHNLHIDDFYQIEDTLISETFITENFPLILDKEKFWSGRKKPLKNLIPIYTELKEEITQYLFYNSFFVEHISLFSFSEIIYNKLDQIKFEREKKFTYDDITFFSYSFLHNKDFSIIDEGSVLNYFYEKLTYRIRFLLIDEFQDTSILQWKIIYPIIDELAVNPSNIKDSSGVVIVGDEKQAIYGWRGGERDLLEKVPQMLQLKDNEIETLNTSYRSEEIVIDYINKIFNFEKNPILNKLNEKQNLNWKYQNVNCSKSKTKGYVETHFFNIAKNEDNTQITEMEIFTNSIDNLINLANSNKIDISKTAIICRRNSDLELAASILREKNVSYLLESSKSIMNYRSIEPIIFFLKFIYYNDIIELIKFLRSDIILLESSTLKKIIKSISKFEQTLSETDYWQNLINDYPDSEIIKTIFFFKNNIFPLNILVTKIIEKFNMVGFYHNLIDIKNTEKFISIVNNFMKMNDYKQNIKGFLEYCEDEQFKESFSQETISEQNAVRLLTIHKSKGLEFETLFFINKLSSGNSNNSGLNSYYKFDNNYRNLEKFATTYNYNTVIENSQLEYLVTEKSNNENVEALNNYYVALTRPKKNLFVYIYINKKINKKIAGFDEVFSIYETECGKDKFQLYKLFYLAIYSQFMNAQHIEQHEGYQLFKFGKLENTEKTESPKSDISLNINNYIEQPLQTISDENIEMPIREKVTNKQKLFGTIVHYYLSFIYTARPQEIKRAKNLTIAYYGNLVSITEIEIQLKKCNKLILNYPEYFSKDWKILNEYSIFDKNGNEFRIDRLMIDSSKKQILIIDYKTGSYSDEQVKNYKQIISELPFAKDYEIKTEYLEI